MKDKDKDLNADNNDQDEDINNLNSFGELKKSKVKSVDVDNELSYVNIKFDSELVIYSLKIASSTFLALLHQNGKFFILFTFIARTYNNAHMINGVGIASVYGLVFMTTFLQTFMLAIDLISPVFFGLKNYVQLGYVMHRILFLSFVAFI